MSVQSGQVQPRHKPSVPDTALIELHSVVLTYPDHDGGGPVEVLQGIDLTVTRGEIVVVAGRSGAGKTTLLNVAAGLLRPTSGAVRWDGTDIAGLGSDALARLRGRTLGMVFQNAALIETLTAAENVALASVPSGVRGGRARVKELLEEMGVASRAGHYPASLSGGEQQRVAIARALYADPPLLIVDEPTANLDRRTADHVLATLDLLASNGRGVLVASHDRHALGIAARVLELEPDS
jgi:ABC-type lipoprotein export system ATPase subunit